MRRLVFQSVAARRSRKSPLDPDSVVLAVRVTEGLFLFRPVVFQFHGLKHCCLRASLDLANLRIEAGVKAGNYSFHTLLRSRRSTSRYEVVMGCGTGAAMEPMLIVIRCI